MPEGSLKVLHVIPSVNAAIGGPAASVTGLATALAGCGVDVSLAALDYQEHGAPLPTPGVTTRYVQPTAAGKLLRGWSPTFGRALESMSEGGVDVVHNHGLWMVPGIYARRLALSRRAPLVISPRGMLEQWSLRHRSGRKSLALALYERRNLEAAALLHATSEAEAQAIREFGCRQPIAVIPNGLARSASRGDRALLEQRFAALQGKRWVLFLGRLHPKKGLPMLLDAWAQLAEERPSWQLVIAGPDLDGHGAQVAAMAAADTRLAGRVTFTGMLQGELKASALAGAQLMVLPTLSENFGIAVAEALAAGMPVLTTKNAPWQSLVEQQCGWWVDAATQALHDALADATALTDGQLSAMGERGRALADRFSWPHIAERFREVYAWLRAQGPKPACVA